MPNFHTVLLQDMNALISKFSLEPGEPMPCRGPQKFLAIQLSHRLLHDCQRYELPLNLFSISWRTTGDTGPTF